MDKYVPPLRIKVSQVAPESTHHTSSSSFSSYKPPSRISSYSSQKSNDVPITPDFGSAADFPSLSSSQVSTPKPQRTQGWSQLARDWAEKDQQDLARKIAEEEKTKNTFGDNSTGGKFFQKTTAPSFSKAKKTVSFDDNNDVYDESKSFPSANPLGIKKDDWY